MFTWLEWGWGVGTKSGKISSAYILERHWRGHVWGKDKAKDTPSGYESFWAASGFPSSAHLSFQDVAAVFWCGACDPPKPGPWPPASSFYLLCSTQNPWFDHNTRLKTILTTLLNSSRPSHSLFLLPEPPHPLIPRGNLFIAEMLIHPSSYLRTQKGPWEYFHQLWSYNSYLYSPWGKGYILVIFLSLVYSTMYDGRQI